MGSFQSKRGKEEEGFIQVFRERNQLRGGGDDMGEKKKKSKSFLSSSIIGEGLSVPDIWNHQPVCKLEGRKTSCK